MNLIAIPASAKTEKENIRALELAIESSWQDIGQKIQNSIQSQASFVQEDQNKSISIQGLNAQLSMTHFELQGLQNAFLQLSNEQLQFNNQSVSFFLNIPEISIDQEIIREVQGAQIRVRLKATCGPIAIKQEIDQISAAYSYKLEENNISGTFSNLIISVRPETFSMESVQCVGPAGLDAVLSKKIAEFFSSSETLSLQLKNYLSPFIQKKLQEQLHAITSGVILPDNVQSFMGLVDTKLIVKNIENSTGGIRALLEWELNSDPSGRILKLPALKSDLNKKLSLIMSKEALLYLVQLKAANSPEWFQESANKYSGFQRILQSRFLQFFLWPDLFSYSKSSLFNLWHRRLILNSLSWDADSVNSKIQFTGWLRSKRDGKIWDYISYYTNARIQFSPQISDGKLSLQTTHLKFQPQFAFGEKYVSIFDPNTWIATSLFQEILQNYLKNKNWEILLPVLKIKDSELLKVNELKSNSDVVTFGF